MKHAVRPCNECPWRRDQPPGRFPPERYDALRCTVASEDGSAPLGAPLFACHKSAEGHDIACAGWLAVEGHGHVGVRLAILQGHLPRSVLQPAAGWPELVASYDEMARLNGSPERGTL